MTATPTPPEGQPDPAPEKPEPRNVIEAVARIMAELPGIGKDSKAAEAQGGYAYRGIEAITAATQRLLGRYGVVFTPRVLKVEIEAITVNGKPWTDTHLTVEYVVRGPGWDPTAPEGTRDEIVVGPLHAIGRDNTDKGSNKAMTQAFKYALIQTFAIGDPKDDADSGSPATDERGQARQGQAKQPEGPPWWEVRGFESEERAQATAEALRASIEKLDADGKEAVAEWLVSHGFVFPDDPEIPEERRGKHRLGVVTADAAKEIEELILVVTPPAGDGETVDPANEAGSGPPVGSEEPAAPEPGDGASSPEAAAQGSTGRRPRTPR